MADRFELSRRKVLGGLGTIGVASAGAGLGTTAFFSDTETFENNKLQAGSLDMKAAYSAHYSDWSEDEDDGLDGEVQMTDPSGGPVADGRVGLPSNVASMISVQDADDAKQFLANTQTGADGDASCSGGTDADDLDKPVIELGDVKPGDFGEVTFSFALCDNPGYVWMNGELVDASENGVTESEADDDDEDQKEDGSLKDANDSEKTVELLDEVKAAVWLDDGNNYQNGGEQPLIVDSLRNVLNELETSGSDRGIRIDGRNVAASDIVPTDFTAHGVNRFDFSTDGDYDLDFELTNDPAGGSGKVAHGTSGGASTTDYATTSVPVGETIGNIKGGSLTYEYYGGADNTNSAPDEVWLLIEETDGTQHVVYHTSNDGDIDAQTWKTRNVHLEVDGDPDPEDNPGYNWFEVTSGGNTKIPDDDGNDGNSVADLGAKYDDDATVVAMAVGLGNIGSASVSDVYYRNPSLNGTSLGHFPTACFRGSADDHDHVHSAVFAWWLPVDHANEIQTDSVEFDLGFYTEQCRHNDGTGMAPENA
ncbi:SipW-dependent-type signal peptide-containing protein [Halomicroarcula sp. F13]|uniref:SipW-dependent-type signal peptide-containing protein n=1 Tax=Haloarcula rubra TaxID=2487747 RepID=A0AAW4PT88_9EURY|nr:SipW-dependent-type signal peptide-containing protein [Halomicroarcula rubra]MBX0324334.1 SipW-dependent-type signal peptide-containing protein [Halomicroarcula rubra]